MFRPKQVSIKVPQMAESISEGTVATFMKQIGDSVEVDEEIISIETDKIDVSVNSPSAGVITELLVAEGDTVTVGQNVASIDTEGSSVESSDASTEQQKDVLTLSSSSSSPPPPPQNNTSSQLQPVDGPLQTSAGKEPQAPVPPPPKATERLTTPQRTPSQQDDVRIAQTPTTKPSAFPADGPPRTERLVPMSRMRRTIAQRLKESQNTAASLTTMQEVDMTALLAFRQRHRESVEKTHGVRLGFMGAFAKAATLAAQRIPDVNAKFDMQNRVIIFRDYVDISIAVSAPKGLVTPVLRNCEAMNVVELERGIAALAKKARDGKLVPDDLQGGNFSISNPGIFGSMFGTPIIASGQSAVLNMNSITDRVVAIDGKPEIRPMMYISLSYDHRLMDGREAVVFLRTVKNYIEDPAGMILL